MLPTTVTEKSDPLISDPASRMSTLFDVAANHFIPYHPGYGSYANPWGTVTGGATQNGGCDGGPSNWLTAALTGGPYDPTAAAAAAATSWFSNYHHPGATSTTTTSTASPNAVSAAVAAYGSSYLSSFPTAGMVTNDKNPF